MAAGSAPLDALNVATADPTATYFTRCRVGHDFAAQVHYRLAVWPPANGVRVGLLVNNPDYPAQTGSVTTERTSFGASGDVGKECGRWRRFRGCGRSDGSTAGEEQASRQADRIHHRGTATQRPKGKGKAESEKVLRVHSSSPAAFSVSLCLCGELPFGCKG